MRHQFEERQHEVSLSLPTAKVFVQGDATRLEQVVSNLLTNAVKYTEPGGRITVALEGEKDNALIRITDNGIPDLTRARSGSVAQWASIAASAARIAARRRVALILPASPPCAGFFY
jgi:C4-dicarboxylate-specific signal transduction histidine kinase